MRLLHPDVPPGDLAKLDGDFRAFMECREPGQAEQQGDDDLGLDPSFLMLVPADSYSFISIS